MLWSDQLKLHRPQVTHDTGLPVGYLIIACITSIKRNNLGGILNVSTIT